MKNTFSKIHPKEKVILALSGGADSVYLLHKLLETHHPNQIILAHINHNLRAKASDTDATFCRKLATKLNLKYEETTLKNLKNLPGNLEENARTARYKFLEDVRKKHKATWILTAHHLNDQVETVLFNLARGTSLSGINGIKSIDKTRHLLRPLLKTQKKEILTYLRTNRIPFRQDKSNLDLDFTRNRIRKNIIPEFEKINSNFLETFSSSIKNLKSHSQNTKQQAKDWLKNNPTEFPLTPFLLLSPILKKTILQLLYKSHNETGITAHQLKEILKTLHQDKSNRQKEFGKNHLLQITKNASGNKRIVVIKRKKL